MPSPQRDRARRRIFFGLAFAIMAIGSAMVQIRPFADPRDRFIGHCDQADLAMVARNIAEGNGPVVDCVWILHKGGLPGNEVTHPEPYWSIYVATLLAPFFKVFGASRQSAMLVGCLVKTGIAALGSSWTWRLTKCCLATTATAAFLLLASYVPVSPLLTDVYLTFFVLAAVTSATYSWSRQSLKGLLLTGILSGIAIGVKPSGLLLIVLLPALAVIRGDRRECIPRLWAIALGTLIAVAPLCLHNYLSYGSLNWPALPLIRSWNLERADYPGNVGILRSIKRFLEGVLEGEFIPLWILPFLVYAFWQVARTYYQRRGRCTNSNFVLIAATLLLICAGIYQATVVRVEWRYWNFIVPFAVVTAIVSCARLSPAFVWFALLSSLFVGLDRHWELWNEPIQPVPAEYAIVTRTLPADAVVMTQNPWEFSFHTRRKSVILDGSGDEKRLRSLADRYHVEYFVIMNSEQQAWSRLDHFDELLSGVFPEWLHRVYYDGNLVIGRFQRDTSSNAVDSRTVSR